MLGNSLLKLEGDDRLDMNCTLPFSDQVMTCVDAVSRRRAVATRSHERKDRVGLAALAVTVT